MMTSAGCARVALGCVALSSAPLCLGLWWLRFPVAHEGSRKASGRAVPQTHTLLRPFHLSSLSPGPQLSTCPLQIRTFHFLRKHTC
ncbi:uncharacterized protein K452DRAFT_11411 [Aplosporella prunicola CBS 121167]|uniref:Uncharacterized protein n=1 Tax=Aplosporella prunicola CBS 121167 TaxID=1176127 RepID=A0A6A6BHA9_9PEZI|nr:uncharacterized protein K452DRAFT_11411 [Aplosporella prunicola CBS 121167]KAF2142833.1 hypothetical protein K452DRAFT_11411 [Aplosporella prunicola CBS 121167]